MANVPAQEAYSKAFTVLFSKLKDPRRTSKGNIKYPFIEILFLTVSSILCGQSDYTLIADFGKINLDWLRKFYPYTNGTCSDDVIGKLFQRINYSALNECMIEWAKETYKLTDDEVIAIDGKRIRGSYDTLSGTLATHIVTAYASKQQICMGQLSTEQKSNEITVIPLLLDAIDIEGAIVSIDAMGCQKEIASKIIEKKADYILAVKDNQKILHEDIIDLFSSNAPKVTNTTLEIGHGRVEKRTATVINNLEAMIENEGWLSLKSLTKIDTEITNKLTKKITRETRYYISSCKDKSAEQMNAMVRQHWAIENNLHWQLDVNFGEDGGRKRKGNAAKNFNIFNKIALTILQRDKTEKFSIKRKKFKAANRTEYRELLMKV